MNARRLSLAGAAVGLLGIGLMWFRSEANRQSSLDPVHRKVDPASLSSGDTPRERRAIQAEPKPNPAPVRNYLDGQPALSPPRPAELSTSDRPPLADLLGAPGTDPAAEPRIMLDVLNAYRRTFAAYPAGEDNRQVVNALLGANEKKFPFIPFDHPRLNSNGEITDAWGTPFFFHSNSRDAIEIRSAGADRTLFTADDIVARDAGPPANLDPNQGSPR